MSEIDQVTKRLNEPPYPWFEPAWHSWVERVDAKRLPHACLLVGEAGSGGLEFARAMAQYLLCRNPSLGVSCRNCKSCTLIDAGFHPDLHEVSVLEDASAIKVDQIREVADFVAQTSQQGGRKIVLIAPAEAMNINAANSLLKNLEEPSGETVFILVSEQANRLLATIRSRCARFEIPVASPTQATEWLIQHGIADPTVLLEEAGGRPLVVLDWIKRDMHTQKQALEEHVCEFLQGRISVMACTKHLGKIELLWLLDTLATQLWQATKAQLSAPAPGKLAQQLTPVAAPRLLSFYDRLLQRKMQVQRGGNPNAELLVNEVLLDLLALYRSA